MRLLIFFAASVVRRARSKVIGAAFLPHGDFAFDPSLVGGADGSSALHDAAVRVGARISAARPDILFVATPHGEAADVPFLFLDAEVAHGTAKIGLDLDRDCAEGCYETSLPVDEIGVASRAKIKRLTATSRRSSRTPLECYLSALVEDASRRRSRRTSRATRLLFCGGGS